MSPSSLCPGTMAVMRAPTGLCDERGDEASGALEVGTVVLVVSHVPDGLDVRMREGAAEIRAVHAYSNACLCLAIAGGRACFVYVGKDEVVA